MAKPPVCPTCGQPPKLTDPQREAIACAALSHFVRYDGASGLFTFTEKTGGTRGDNIFNAKFSGKRAGYVNTQGYVVIGFNLNRKPVIVRCHRLAWFLSHGSLPAGQIDHINRDRTDNRMCNLRAVTNAENARNRGMGRRNSSGVTGVRWHTGRGKWMARVKVDYKEHYLGYFTDLSAAADAVKQFRAQHGFSNSHGE